LLRLVLASALRRGREDVEPKNQRTVLCKTIPAGENVPLQGLAFPLTEAARGLCERRAPDVLPQEVLRRG
jgi:hypothetical protein